MLDDTSMDILRSMTSQDLLAAGHAADTMGLKDVRRAVKQILAERVKEYLMAGVEQLSVIEDEQA